MEDFVSYYWTKSAPTSTIRQASTLGRRVNVNSTGTRVQTIVYTRTGKPTTTAL